jgi:hypothetical protein
VIGPPALFALDDMKQLLLRSSQLNATGAKLLQMLSRQYPTLVI